MDDHRSMLALLGTVNRALADQGVDPLTVSDEDKILIAAQYVETAAEREKMLLTTPTEVRPVVPVLDTAP